MNGHFRRIFRLLTISLICSFVAACSTTPRLDDSKIIDNTDLFEDTNRSIYAFNDALDRYLMKPVASRYAVVTPDPFRIGITNFFDNLEYLNVILNSSLQGKIDQGVSDLFRFIFNSTLGIGGLFDVATPMGLEEHDEDLGQTFAIWGSSQGAFLTLPGIGPNTVRNTPNLVSSYLLNPMTYLSTMVSLPVAALNFINKRANFLDSTDFRDSAAIDPYSFTREAYLQLRRNLIYDGNPPPDSFDELFDFKFEEESLQ